LRSEQHFRFIEQIDDRVDRLLLSIPDPIELIGMGKVDQQIGNVRGHILVGPSEMFDETFLGQGAEQLAERMSWRYRRSHRHLTLPSITLTVVIIAESHCHFGAFLPARLSPPSRRLEPDRS